MIVPTLLAVVNAAAKRLKKTDFATGVGKGPTGTTCTCRQSRRSGNTGSKPVRRFVPSGATGIHEDPPMLWRNTGAVKNIGAVVPVGTITGRRTLRLDKTKEEVGMKFTDAQFAALKQAAEEEGVAAGRAAGCWAIDGNTPDDTVRTMLRQIEDGDPALEPPPSPMAGESGDDPEPKEVLQEILDAVDMVADWNASEVIEDEPETADELLNLWTDSWISGWYQQVEEDCRARLTPSEA